ncbi:hypothetical protein BVY04_02585 [bacterium M21]|nr:hypothetical protein BVY04_02585 [bacterium M21]
MPAKEDLTQAERDKIEIGPDFDFREIAKRPFESLSTNEIAMFKWSGIYHQLQKGFFMIRLRLPGGVMNAEQLHRASELAETYGQDRMCITTRQTLQYHWIRQQDLYKIQEGVEEVGLDTRNACGDVNRNVVSCALVGVCPHEVTDTLAVIDRLANDDELLNVQRNLPKKHKISVGGCGRACAQTLMNCQGWHPVTREVDGKSVVGWRYYAGGGLGARPYIAKRIFDWVPDELILPVTQAAVEAYRRLGNRRVRAFARLKVVVDKLGAKGFGEKVIEIMHERGDTETDAIEFAVDGPDIGDSFLQGQIVIEQKQPGFNSVRVMIPRGELTGGQGHKLADLAEQFGDGTIAYTNRQNILFRFVPDAKVDGLLIELRAMGWDLESQDRLPDAVACVGITMCNLAVADTPATYEAIMRELTADKAWWEKIGPLNINMSGCPNNCTQAWVHDIGLRGIRKREEVGSDEGFSLYVGGTLAEGGKIGDYVCDIFGPEVVETLRTVLSIYLDERQDIESFGTYARRVGGDAIREKLIRAAAEGQPVNERNLELNSIYKQAAGLI